MDLSDEVLKIANTYLRGVRKSGPENIMAICPFHRKADGSEESGPSFSMSLVKGVYFCHSCKEKGTLRKFLTLVGLDHRTVKLHYEGVLEEVSKNIEVRPDPVSPKSIFQDEAPIDEAVLGLFDYDVSALLPNYTTETLKHFEVGWDGWNYRITFPVRNVSGELVGISGRAVNPDQKPRYKIYDKEYKAWKFPERRGWNKRTVAWHADSVYPEILLMPGNPNQSYVVVVEGFKAAMSVWQAGYTNVIALLGSYLSWEHQWLLEKMGCPVYFFLDNDDAGYKGTVYAGESMYATNQTYLVQYPERLKNDPKAQPDDLTADEIAYQLNNAITFGEWHRYYRNPHVIR